MAFGTNQKVRRESMGMSQAELADKTGVRAPMINQIEMGTKIPSLALAISIAKELGCSMDYLCDTEFVTTKI